MNPQQVLTSDLIFIKIMIQMKTQNLLQITLTMCQVQASRLMCLRIVKMVSTINLEEEWALCDIERQQLREMFRTCNENVLTQASRSATLESVLS